jgi:hypothetical protein
VGFAGTGDGPDDDTIAVLTLAVRQIAADQEYPGPALLTAFISVVERLLAHVAVLPVIRAKDYLW